MKSKELITELSMRLGWEPREITEMLGHFSTAIGSSLVDNNTVYLQGLGHFEARKKLERISVNPANGKRYLVPPKLTPVFKPGSTVKANLKKLNPDE